MRVRTGFLANQSASQEPGNKWGLNVEDIHNCKSTVALKILRKTSDKSQGTIREDSSNRGWQPMLQQINIRFLT